MRAAGRWHASSVLDRDDEQPLQRTRDPALACPRTPPQPRHGRTRNDRIAVALRLHAGGRVRQVEAGEFWSRRRRRCRRVRSRESGRPAAWAYRPGSPGRGGWCWPGRSRHSGRPTERDCDGGWRGRGGYPRVAACSTSARPSRASATRWWRGNEIHRHTGVISGAADLGIAPRWLDVSGRAPNPVGWTRSDDHGERDFGGTTRTQRRGACPIRT